MRDLEAVRDRLRTRALGRSLELRESTGSTMDDVREAIAAGAPSGHVIVADAQHGGRGTHGRAWSSPPGLDLYLSIATRPSVPIERVSTMTLAVGLGVARTVDAFVGASRARVKWPNDVLVDGAKCAGILVESRATSEGIDGIVVGIGLNCNRRAFDAVGDRAATSLALAGGREVDRAEVLATLLLEVESALDAWSTELAGTVAAVEARLAYRDEAVRLDDARGTLLGLAPDGALVLRTADGPRSFNAGRLEVVQGDQ